MRPLSVPELLAVWELGLGAMPLQRALTILSAANPGSSPPALARLSIGRRDSDLLQLREWAFGKDLTIVAACPSCNQTLELTLQIEQLRRASGPKSDSADETDGCAELRDREQHRYNICFRPLNSEDIASCAGLELAAARRKLLGCCVLEARREGVSVAPEELPEELAQPLLDSVAASDPAAETRIELSCPECHTNWNEVFDIVSFFWTEIDAWARRTLRDVNVLARAYGWREGEILAMSPMRRQIYMAMAQA